MGGRSHRLAAVLASILAGSSGLLAACQPVPLRAGETVRADVSVPGTVPPVNLAVIGIGDGTQPIELHATGFRIGRGQSANVGIAGPGVVEGTSFAVIGIGFDLRLVRFGTTQGGGQEPIPAAVLSLAVGPDVEPGLYSVIAIRGTEYAVFAGGVEVF